MVRGRLIYVPKSLLTEITDIKQEENINKNARAIDSLVDHARVGREMNRILSFKFGWLPTKQDYKRKRQ
jgi:hypothetical protein